MADVGDYLTNAPYQDRWTCPACYHDHNGEVDRCDSCGVALSCTTEMQPIAVCTIADPADRDEA